MNKKAILILTLTISSIALLAILGLNSPRLMTAPDKYAACKPITDLVEQHRCLMRVAIDSSDDARLRRLIQTPYVDINERHAIGNRSYLAYAGSVISSGRLHPRRGLFEILFDGGADASLDGQAIFTILGFIAKYQTDSAKLSEVEAILNLFLDHGQYVDEEFRYLKPVNDRNLLGVAVSGCKADTGPNMARVRFVNELLSRNASVNWRNALDVSALHQISVWFSNDDSARACAAMIDLLTGAGADMTAKTKSGLTAIDYTAVGIRKADRGSSQTCTTLEANIFPRYLQVFRAQRIAMQALLSAGSAAHSIGGDKFQCPELLQF